MDKKLLKKLQNYSLLAGSVATAGAVDGQIVYTDINPDKVFTGLGTYNLDLNNDVTTDFTISVSTSVSTSTTGTYFSNYVYITPQGGNQVAGTGSYGNTWNYPYALSANAVIDQGKNWVNGATSKSALGSYFSSTGTYGNWLGASNKYLGLRVTIGTDTIYGWARLDVNTTASSFTIKDYAYQSFPGVPILAGDTTHIDAPLATNVLGADVANNGNGLDLQISFNKPVSEVGIKEYRIYIVDSAKAGTFNIDSAKAVASGDYVVHKPNGSNYSSVMQATTTDVDGNLIVNNQPYNIFVLSVPDGTNNNNPIMTKASPVVTLHTVTGIDDLRKNEIKVYATDQNIVLQTTAEYLGREYTVLDNMGRIVINNKIHANRELINTTGLARGIYHVRVSGDQPITTKVILR